MKPIRGRPVGTGRYHGLEKEMRLDYHRMKAQAKFRNETFELTLEDYVLIWGGADYSNRGNGWNKIHLGRTDEFLPWSLTNCKLMMGYNSELTTLK